MSVALEVYAKYEVDLLVCVINQLLPDVYTGSADYNVKSPLFSINI